MTDWKEATNRVIAHQQLDNIASLINGRWYRTETLDYKGRRTEKFIIERDITEESNSSDPDVPGSDSSDT